MKQPEGLLKTLAGVVAAISPGCKEAVRLQSDAMYRRLPLLQRLGLRVHLLFCKWCRRYGRQIRFLRNAAHQHPDELAEPAPRKLPAEARDRIKQRLRADSQ